MLLQFLADVINRDLYGFLWSLGIQYIKGKDSVMVILLLVVGINKSLRLRLTVACSKLLVTLYVVLLELLKKLSSEHKTFK